MVPFSLFAVLGLSLVLLEWRLARRKSRQGHEEELAHKGALTRRKLSPEERTPERRKERRYAVAAVPVTASVLGDGGAAMDCRILDVSRSGMRIAISQPLPQNAQISVAWGNQCFVGTSCYSFVKGDEHILGLRAIASTCPDLGFLTDVKYQWNELRWRAERGAAIWGKRTTHLATISRRIGLKKAS
jgi:hypothetical protein